MTDLIVSDHSRLQNTEQILALFGYLHCEQDAKMTLEGRAPSAELFC